MAQTQNRKLGRKIGDSPGQARRVALFPFSGETTDRKFRFWKQDGASLDQNGYGTCVAFAESHRIADAPVYHRDVDNQYAFKLYRDATGDTSMQEGTWANVVAEELLRRGTITRFEWITTAEDLQYAVLEKGPVPIGIPWYNSMFNTEVDENGKHWLIVDPSSGEAGGHEILLNGLRLDSDEPFYRLKNSWGTWWADNGTARISVDQVNDLVFNTWGDAIWIKETTR